ncbi:MAG: YggS family pyridoxal phosphate-dependent enzyme [Clostridiales bacterium]|nr:YggS family pyridoxal phosphate-dependent enzyme [Clostridiales bacterium]
MTVRSSTEFNLKDIEYNYKLINEKVSASCQKVGKSREEIMFLSAVKTVPCDIINYAISLGLKYIGENKVQELLQKYDEYDLKNAELQFIGHLQTNKVKQIIDKVTLIQSVDSIRLAGEISKRAEELNKSVDVLIEVNAAGEQSKWGVDTERLYDFIDEARQFKGINIKGLMTIPPICENQDENRKYFSKIYKMFIDIQSKKMDNVDMRILSMGMSDDYTAAIEEGANMVRIGSALFGKRVYY